MRYFKHNFNSPLPYATVQCSKNFVRHLRQYLHLTDDQPLVLYGGLTMLAQGFGWYRVYAYNPHEKGQDIEFALKQLDLCVKWMDRKITSEIRALLSYGVAGPDRFDHDAQRRASEAILADKGVTKDLDRLSSVTNQPATRPATPNMLNSLQRRLNNRFHRS